KEFELARVVVDEVVSGEDGFVAAEDDVGVRDEGEVAAEPLELGVERAWDLHRSGCDEDFVALLQGLEDARRVGHHVEHGEEVFGPKVVVERVVVRLGDDLPEALAVEVGLGEGGGEVAVVAEEVLGDGVSHDLVHVDADALAGAGLIHESILFGREADSFAFDWRRTLRNDKSKYGDSSPAAQNDKQR